MFSRDYFERVVFSWPSKAELLNYAYDRSSKRSPSVGSLSPLISRGLQC